MVAEFVFVNLTFTVTPFVNVKSVVTGEIVATFTAVPAAVGHSAYHIDWPKAVFATVETLLILS